jgi:hypothetical protein
MIWSARAILCDQVIDRDGGHRGGDWPRASQRSAFAIGFDANADAPRPEDVFLGFSRRAYWPFDDEPEAKRVPDQNPCGRHARRIEQNAVLGQQR